MYQRDYLLNEARKFALLLARLMGLKTEGRHEEFTQELEQILQTEYDTELEYMLGLNADEFASAIKAKAYSAEKLNALSQLFYVFAQPFQPDDTTALLLRKVLLLFDTLEEEHHYQSFENIDKRNNIYRYLKQHNE
jgi:hypothetical protein